MPGGAQNFARPALSVNMNRAMSRFFPLLCLLLPTICSGAEQLRLSMQHDGVMRHYEVYLPTAWQDQAEPALLVVLHGLRGSGSRVAELSAFNARAERQGFIVVYPDSQASRWNYLYAIPGAFDGPDDPGFLTRLTDSLSATYHIDATRRFIIGISNGGFMAQRMACEPESRYAGFASVAAGGFAALPGSCARATPVDALYLHGTEDRLVPWQGRMVEDAEGERQQVTLSVTESLKFWAAHNRCEQAIDTEDLPSKGQSPGTRVRVYSTRQCIAEARVRLYAVIGGGHNWPGAAGRISPSVAGRVNLDIHASDVISEFFLGER